jgi:hypothetical protein
MAYWPFWEMRLRSAVAQEIRDLIQKTGRITFAQFMQACLYSPHGGLYSSRGTRISTHFGTSPTSHPVFGALIARQLEQMWHLLGDPPVFHVMEVGSGDGALAQAIVHACGRMAPRLAQVLYYVAADYEPRWLPSPDHPFDWDNGTGDGMSPSRRDAIVGVQRVKTEGLRAFRNIVGCILEFIPIKPSVARASGASGSYVGHSRSPSPDRGRPPSTGGSGLARCDNV